MAAAALASRSRRRESVEARDDLGRVERGAFRAAWRGVRGLGAIFGLFWTRKLMDSMMTDGSVQRVASRGEAARRATRGRARHLREDMDDA